MDYHQMTAPCGLDCFNCAFFLAHEDQEAMKQVEQWSEELNIPVINNRISIAYGLEKVGTFDAEVLCKKLK